MKILYYHGLENIYHTILTDSSNSSSAWQSQWYLLPRPIVVTGSDLRESRATHLTVDGPSGAQATGPTLKEDFILGKDSYPCHVCLRIESRFISTNIHYSAYFSTHCDAIHMGGNFPTHCICRKTRICQPSKISIADFPRSTRPINIFKQRSSVSWGPTLIMWMNVDLSASSCRGSIILGLIQLERQISYWAPAYFSGKINFVCPICSVLESLNSSHPLEWLKH